jgi:hypothetical protein
MFFLIATFFSNEKTLRGVMQTINELSVTQMAEMRVIYHF